jgi:Rrf2 family protein
LISQAAEYAMRAVLLLARASGRPLTNQQIAASARIPGGYLAKVLQHLVRAGIVASQRGAKGGFVLGRSPDRLTLMDVVEAVDPSRRIANCPLGLPEHANRLCPLHDRVDAAMAAAERELRAATIVELLAAEDCQCCPNSSTDRCQSFTRTLDVQSTTTEL